MNFKNASRLAATFVAIFIIGGILVAQPQALAEKAGSDLTEKSGQLATPEIEESHSPFPSLELAAKTIWAEFRWYVLAFAIVLAVKKYMIKQSNREIVACIFETLAFLVKHAVDIARYVAIQLKKIARQLRDIQSDSDK